MCKPAMSHYLEVERGNMVQIGFKSKSLFLSAPEAQSPLNRAKGAAVNVPSLRHPQSAAAKTSTGLSPGWS